MDPMDIKSRQDAWTEEDDLLLAETVLKHVREGSTQLNAFEEVGDLLNRTSAACGFRWNAVIRHKYEKALQLAKKLRKEKKRAIAQSHGTKPKKNLLYNPNSPSYEEEIEAMQTRSVREHFFAPTEELEAQISEPVSKSIPAFAFEVSEELATTPRPSENRGITMEQVISFLRNTQLQNSQNTMAEVELKRLQFENQELRIKIKEREDQILRLEQEANSMHEDYDTLMKILNRARKLVLFDEEEHSAPTFRMDKNGNLEKIAE